MQRLTHLIGHRAQIFAHDQAAVALALQGENAEQVFERIAHVGAFRDGQAARDPEQAEQAHHVVLAQRSGIAHVGAQQLDEGRIGCLGQLMGNPGRQAPVLSEPVDLVRWRAGIGGQCVKFALHPGCGAAFRHPDRQVEHHADAETQFPRTRAGCTQLTGNLPLQVLEVFDPFQVGAAECRDLGCMRVAVNFRPCGPAPHCAVLSMKILLQRLEQRLLTQALAALGLKDAESLPAVGVLAQVTGTEMLVQAFKNLRLHLRDTAVIHLLGGAEGPQSSLELRSEHYRTRLFALGKIGNGFNVQIQCIEIGAAGRTVWARVFRRMRKQRMQRVKQYRAGPGCSTEFNQMAQVAEISDAIIVLGADAVELDSEPPCALFSMNQRRFIAGGGRDDEHHFRNDATPVRAFDGEAVIARFHREVQHQRPPHEFPAIKMAAFRLFQRGGYEFACVPGARFPAQIPAIGQFILARRQCDGDAIWPRRFAYHLHRRQRPLPFALLESLQGYGDFFFRARRHPHGRKQGALRGFGGKMGIAPDITITGQDAIPVAQLIKRIAHGFPFGPDIRVSFRASTPRTTD